MLISALQAQVDFQPWTLAQARQQASEQDRLFFLYFTAEWCAPCRWMQKHTFANAQLQRYLAEHYLAVAVDIDEGSAALLRQQFTVETIPTILVFSAAGQLIDRRTGTLLPEQLEQWLRHLDRPVHHLDASQAPSTATNTLPSPQAHLTFSRPALGSTKALTAPALTQQTKPALLLSGQPLIAATTPPAEAFVPRNANSYTVVLSDSIYSYSEALRQVPALERKYKVRTELQLQTNGSYRLVLGNFTDRQAAEAFLRYLRRNNRRGQVLPLSR